MPIKRVLKIVSLKNFDGCTSCMPSSPKEYKHPWLHGVSAELFLELLLVSKMGWIQREGDGGDHPLLTLIIDL